MTLTPCPHCGTTIQQRRKDGRCSACGKLLPEAIRAPLAMTPLLDADIRSYPILEVPERTPTLIPSFLVRGPSSPGNVLSTDRPAPMHGVEHAVPWPIPLRPESSVMSFWGSGNQTTQPFTLFGDAALRIVIESGLLFLRVLLPDGNQLGNESKMAGPGLALDSIPMGGTFTLEVLATARWAITVIYYAEPSTM
jgi:hypothetical protein